MNRPLIHISSAREEISALLSPAAAAILRTLAYYDIFHYPLTTGEIRQFMGIRADLHCFNKHIAQLLEQGKIFSHGGFYSLQNNPLLAHRRRQGNRQAEILLDKAHHIGRFLYQFPFVRGIGISGSLSKNYADEKADIDFFIITRSDRLWIARTCMHLYKKLMFLFNRQHYYCMNYYIDEEALQLEDKNIFTATELKTLLPVAGTETMQLFFEANDWSDEWLPACDFRQQQQQDPPKSSLKNSIEWLLNGRIGNIAELFFRNTTQRRWKRKEEKGKRNKKGQTMELIIQTHSARSNPGAFQEKVLALYEQKLSILK